VESAEDLDTLIENVPTGVPVPVLVQRQKSPMFLALTVPGDG